MALAEIQIWSQYHPLPVGDFQNSSFRIRIDDPSPLPLELETKVSRNWEDQTRKNQTYKDNLVLFLSGKPQEINGILTIPTQERWFRYVAAFSRNESFPNRMALLTKYKLLYLSTHCIIVTEDNRIILGTKKNQFNQISNFGGFPQVQEESVLVEGRKYLDIRKCLHNRLQAEILSPSDITSIHAIGITYVGRPGLQGCDTNYVVRVSQTAEHLIHKFITNYNTDGQFKRELFQVPFKPRSIMKFIREMHHQGHVFSPFALGCLATTFKLQFGGIGELPKLVKELGTSIAVGNQTKYLQT